MVNIEALARDKEKEIRNDMNGHVKNMKDISIGIKETVDEGIKNNKRIILKGFLGGQFKKYTSLRKEYVEKYDLDFSGEDAQIKSHLEDANLTDLYKELIQKQEA